MLAASKESATPQHTSTALHLTEQTALEQLAAFSLLARWIDECTVHSAEPTERKGGQSAQQAEPGTTTPL